MEKGLKILIGLILLLVISIIVFLVVKKYYEGKDKEVIISYKIHGKLEDAEISPATLTLEKGDILIIQTESYVKKNVSLLKDKKVHFSKIATFNIPGKKGKFWLGDQETMTAFEIEEAGVMEFSTSYPSTMTNFTTFKKKHGNEVFGPAKLKIIITKKMPQKFVAPRQLVRAKGIMGTLLPDIEAEKKERDFNLRDLSKKKAQELLEDKDKDKEKEGQKSNLTKV